MNAKGMLANFPKMGWVTGPDVVTGTTNASGSSLDPEAAPYASLWKRWEPSWGHSDSEFENCQCVSCQWTRRKQTRKNGSRVSSAGWSDDLYGVCLSYFLAEFTLADFTLSVKCFPFYFVQNLPFDKYSMSPYTESGVRWLESGQKRRCFCGVRAFGCGCKDLQSPAHPCLYTSSALSSLCSSTCLHSERSAIRWTQRDYRIGEASNPGPPLSAAEIDQWNHDKIMAELNATGVEDCGAPSRQKWKMVDAEAAPGVFRSSLGKKRTSQTWKVFTVDSVSSGRANGTLCKHSDVNKLMDSLLLNAIQTARACIQLTPTLL